MKISLTICFMLFVVYAAYAQKITREDYDYVRDQAGELLKGSIVKSDSGTDIYTPDGMAHYNALWTRDFAYMVRNAGELIPAKDIYDGIEYTLGGMRLDGAMPDRVQSDGRVVYVAGGVNNPLGEPNLDDGQFIVLTAYDYLVNCSGLDREGRIAQFKKWAPRLKKGMDYIPLSGSGLVYNDPLCPHSPYGFHDCVKKCGSLFKESVLYWEACMKLSELYSTAGMKTEAKDFLSRAERIERSVSELWSSADGMFLAATLNCNQVDIWGNIYALYAGFPMSPAQKKTIGANLVENYDRYVFHGQVRHLYAGEYWEDMLEQVKPETYQNGGYWGTASGWLITVLAKFDRPLAERTARDLIDYFRNKGFFECVNDNYEKLDKFVVSATNALPAVKALADHK